MSKIPGRCMAALCCALAIALLALTTWDGMEQLNAAITQHMGEQLTNVTSYASLYTRACFKRLLHTGENLALVLAQSDDILDAGMLDALDQIGREAGAYDVAVERVEQAGELPGGIQAEYGEEGTTLRISTPIVRGGDTVGMLTGEYRADEIAAELNEAFAEAEYEFSVFMPDGRFVLHSANSALPAGGDSFYSIENARFAEGYSFDTVLADIKAGRSGLVQCVSPGGERLMGYYTLLGINDWYIICVVPRSAYSVLSAECLYVLIVMAVKLSIMGVLLALALVAIKRRRLRDAGEYVDLLKTRLRKQRAALDTLGAPPFEFDMRALEAHPLDPSDHSCDWLMERILIPDHAGEVVDPRDEAAYLKLCDAAITTRGTLTGNFRLRLKPGAPTRMYRVTLSAPEHSGDTVSTVATLVDMDDVAGRMEKIRLRAARDELTGLNTLSEFRLRAKALLGRPTHHFGALAFIRADNADAVCDSGAGMTQEELLPQCAAALSDLMGECDVIARGTGCEFWVFSGDQTGAEIVQKGMSRLMESELGAGEIKLTFSCGISRADPDDGIDDLMRRAYDAAQLAHRDGGHRVQHG